MQVASMLRGYKAAGKRAAGDMSGYLLSDKKQSANETAREAGEGLPVSK